jgi:hypothetical protein
MSREPGEEKEKRNYKKRRDKNPVHIPLYLSLSSQNSKPVVIYDIFQKKMMIMPANVVSINFLIEPANDDHHLFCPAM